MISETGTSYTAREFVGGGPWDGQCRAVESLSIGLSIPWGDGMWTGYRLCGGGCGKMVYLRSRPCSVGALWKYEQDNPAMCAGCEVQA